MLAMAEAGADVIELGVPFSDPMADGPVIQKAAERALTKGISLTHVLADVKAFRARNATTPVVLMGYANPIEAYDQHHGAGRLRARCQGFGRGWRAGGGLSA
jgi:tryptophan synthase alpha chain